jgi:GTP-binding protein
MPEFAFIGRSNVGKSSLLNMLVGAKALARVSATPGHTQLINSYVIDKSWCLVDLPGYGYAKTSKAARERFAQVIATYLSGRENLAWIFVLIDSRHSPQQIDLEFVQWLVGGIVPFALVFTKADLVKPGALRKNIGLFQEQLVAGGLVPPQVFTASSKTRSGRPELLAFIRETLGRERTIP